MGGRSPHELGAPRPPLPSRKQDHPVTRSLPIPPFLLTTLRKVSGSPRRLLARGVRSPGPSGRGVGEGSLSGRGPATANFGCDRLGTREDRRKQRFITKPHWRGTRPRRGRSGQGARTGAARAARASGDPAHAPTAARESLFPASPRARDLLPCSRGRKDPRTAAPAPTPTIPFLPALGCGPGAGGTVTGERSARAQVPGARRRRRRRLPLLPPALPPLASLAPDRSPPPSALPAPPGARRAGLGLRLGAERSRREPGCGAHCVKRWASAGRRRRRQRAASPGPAGQAGQRRLRLRLLRLRRGRGGGGRGRAEVVAHSF